MIKAKTMMGLTPPAVRKRSRDCQTMVVKSVLSSDDIGRAVKVVVTRSYATDGVRYGIYKFYLPKTHLAKKGKDPLNTTSWVWCSCPYFKYTCEVALWFRNASSIIFSNGAFPRVRNPSIRPFVCKHLYAGLPIAAKSSYSEHPRTVQSVENLMDKIFEARGKSIHTLRKRKPKRKRRKR